MIGPCCASSRLCLTLPLVSARLVSGGADAYLRYTPKGIYFSFNALSTIETMDAKLVTQSSNLADLKHALGAILKV